MDPLHDPWVPAPRDGDRADVRAGGDPWAPTIPFPRVAPAVERLPQPVPPVALPTPTALAVRDVPAPGVVGVCVRAVTRIVHATVDGVRSVLGLFVAAPASR